MRTLLEEFWYGNVNPQEQSTEGNREIKNLLNLMGKNRDNLSDTLTDEQKETLAKYDDCVNEMYGIIEREIFSYAFRLGGRFMLESIIAERSQRPAQFGSAPHLTPSEKSTVLQSKFPKALSFPLRRKHWAAQMPLMIK